MKFDPANPDRISDRVRRTFDQAEALAMARNSSDIAPEDKLLALARGERGLGHCMLEGMSIELDKLQDELAVLVPHCRRDATCAAELGFSPDALRVLALAKAEAAALGHHYLATEHLILGLLRDEKSQAGSFLREHSATIGRAREILLAILADPSSIS